MRTNIDTKDKKIIYELDADSRQSYSQLARKVGLSKQVVEYRVNRLIKKKIIEGFYAVVNMHKLGYIYGRLTITLQNVSETDVNTIVQDLREDSRVFWLFEMQGSFDIFMIVWVENLNAYRLFVQDVLEKYGAFVKRRVENIATDVIHYQHRYLLGKHETTEIHIAETPIRVHIDDLDKSILSLLCENTRIPLVEMGLKLKEHPKTLAYRIARLERMRLIEGYRVIINHQLLGYTYYKVFINLSRYAPKDIQRVKEIIKNNPATIYFIEGINLHGDIDIEIMVKSNEELLALIKSLRAQLPGVISDYNAVIFMKTLKVKYLPF